MIDIGVLTVLVVVFAVLSVRAVVRLIRKIRSIWRKEGGISLVYVVVMVVLWLGLLGVSGFFEFRHQLAFYTASAVSRDVSGKSNAVARCQRRAVDMFNFMGFFYLGWVWSDKPNVAHLRTDTCGDFGDWLMSDKRQASREQIQALQVVIHEAVHIGGELNEARTECKAMDHYERVATGLGATREEARRMLEYYKTNIYPGMPGEYRMDCTAK